MTFIAQVMSPLFLRTDVSSKSDENMPQFTEILIPLPSDTHIWEYSPLSLFNKRQYLSVSSNDYFEFRESYGLQYPLENPTIICITLAIAI